MSPLTRFLRFNLVGLFGIVIQLTTLALLNRAIPARYLLTSTLAVELTLLHNFTWHIRYTWPQAKITRHSATSALLRFHLSNGLISLLGNLGLMRAFVRSFHWPVLLANALAIICSGLANFFLAHNWVFTRKHTPRSTAKTVIASCVLVFLFASAARGQSMALPSAPSPHSQDYGVDCARKVVRLELRDYFLISEPETTDPQPASRTRKTDRRLIHILA